MTHNVYQPTAYNSNNIRPQPPRPEKTLARKLLSVGQSELAWHKPVATTICTRIAPHFTPSKERQQTEKNTGKESFWNNTSLEMYRANGWTHACLILASLTKITVLFLTPFSLVISLLLYAITSGEVDIVQFGIFYVKYVLIPCFLIWGFFELYNRGYWEPYLLKKLMGVRKTFALNRCTGMVTLYKCSGSVRYSYPFLEFDCILSTTPGPQGQVNHSLLLAHRYSGSMHGVPLGSLVTGYETTEEYECLWNMIQCYMDISQPLPDSLILEESRHLDPVTAEFDQKINRDPRYWRDMSDEDYAKTIAAIQNQQRTQPETGSVLNIFAEAS